MGREVVSREGEVGFWRGGRQGCEEMKWGCVEAQEKPGTEREGKKETVFTVHFQFTFAQMCCLKPQEVLVGLTLLSSLCVCVCGTPAPLFFSLNITTHRHNHLRIFLLPGDGISRTSCLLVSFKPELSQASYGK